MNKVYPDAKAALDGLLHDNMTIAAGGFGLCGIPENLIAAVHDSGVKGLTIVGNNAGVDNYGMGITAELSIVKAWKGDKSGNLIYRETARNFNPMIATCGKVCVAEVEQLVELGELDPDQIHTPGIFVDRIIQGAKYEKRIEFRTVQGADPNKKTSSPVRDLMAKRAAQELRDGYYVSLGFGIPTLISTSLP